MGLRNDQVISVREQIEGILEEVYRAAINCSLHTEDCNSKRVLCTLRRVWNGVKITNSLANTLDFRVVAVSGLILNRREQ